MNLDMDSVTNKQKRLSDLAGSSRGTNEELTAEPACRFRTWMGISDYIAYDRTTHRTPRKTS